MEIGDHFPDYFVLISRCDDNLSTAMQRFHFVAVQIIQNLLQGFHWSQFILIFIGHPLLYVQFVLGGIRVMVDKDPDILKTFQGAYRSGSYRNGFSIMGD